MSRQNLHIIVQTIGVTSLSFVTSAGGPIDISRRFLLPLDFENGDVTIMQ